MAKQELARECDYVLEASNQKRYKELLSDSDGYYVPKVIDQLSSKKVLTSEFVPGILSNNAMIVFCPVYVLFSISRLDYDNFLDMLSYLV